MRECIYCRKEKEDKEFSLEHVIPQFLGGSQAPDCLKTRDVCKTCNSNLGLFVDAAFEKDFLVFNHLNESAYAFFNPNAPVGLPLRCMGNSDLMPPEMQADEACECWLGPLGEQVYWVRPKDERMYWYSGGNPRTVKKLKYRAYFMFSERSNKNQMLSWLSFKDAFEGRRVQKILCTRVEGADPKTIGFSDPDSLDMQRIQYFNQECSSGRERKNKLAMYTRFDIRFMAKLGIGIAYVLFGRKILNTEYMLELSKALWFKEGDPEPNILGTSALSETDDFLKVNCGIDYAVTITILPLSEGIAINLNISTKLNWVIKCATYDELSAQDIEVLGHGICIVLFKPLQLGFKLGLPELIAHNSGSAIHPKLDKVSKLANEHRDYFKNL